MEENLEVYDHIEPDIEKWAIHQLALNRNQFIGEIRDATFKNIKEKHGKDLSKLLERVIYSEIIRTNKTPWRVDPPKEKQYWQHLKTKLAKHGKDNIEIQNSILSQITEGYSQEVVGAFVPKTFRFARKFLTGFFGLLLNKNKLGKGEKKWGVKNNLYSRLKLFGDIDHIRSLAKKGTLVVVPTHFSNLDSILIGYAVDAKVGIPALSYGAGLNLYNFGPAAYFMNRLGAYRVDRRKKNSVYLEVLKNMSKISIEKGVHNLFFPEGTRSRSNIPADNLKLGLLNTAVEAQRTVLTKGDNKRIFVVPLILDYHFVLESKFLIRSYLKSTGRERYTRVRDMGKSKRKIFKFLWQYLTKSSEIVLSFGEPMDVLGNKVDFEGNSIDKRGNQINLRDYFELDGEISKNIQRESEYTKILSKEITESYKKDNVVLSSHLLTYTAFKLLQEQHASLDLFDILQLPKTEIQIKEDALVDRLRILQQELKQMESSNLIRLSEPIYWEPLDLMQDALKHIGLYHSKKVFYKNKIGLYTSNDLELLYYYHNRITTYGLNKFFKLGERFQPEKVEE